MAQGNLGRTTATLAARTSEFNRDMIRASRTMRRFGREARSAIRLASRVAIGLAFGGGALGATVKHLSDSATALQELSISSGIAVPRLQQLQRVFEADGLSAEAFAKSIQTLQRNIGNAARGDQEYLEGFEELGIGLRNASGDIRGTEKILGDLVERLSQIPPALQASYASEFFGRGARDMLTTFARMEGSVESFNEELARIDALLPTLTGDTASQLKAVNQAFTDAGNAAETYGQLVVASVGPELIAGIENTLRLVKNNSAQITGALQTVARNIDLLIGASLLIAFRRLGAALVLAQARFIKFYVTIFATDTAGAIATLRKGFRGLAVSLGLLVKQTLIAAAGFASLLYAANLVKNALAGDGLDFGKSFDDTLAQITRAYTEFSGIFSGGVDDVPVIQIEAQVDAAPVRAIQQEINDLTAQVNVVRVEAETFGLAEQITALENQRNLLLASGDEAVRLAARQQFLANVNKELAAAYGQLERAQMNLASQGDNPDIGRAEELREEVNSLVDRIQYLNGIQINPDFNSDAIDEIVALNQQIAEISGKRQAEISVDMRVDFGGSLDETRQRLEAELGLLEQVASGNINFGIAEQMKVEVNAAIIELNSVRSRIANNERLLNLMPDITEAERLNAELVRLRSLAATIEFNISNTDVLKESAQEVVNLQNRIQALQRQQEFARSAANQFTDALGGFITGATSGSDAVKGLIGSLANLVLQYTVLIPLAQSLAAAFGSTSLFGIGGIGAAATGGFHKGLTLVGERGPELIDAGSGSRIYTNDQLADAVGNGGGQNIVVTNNISIDSTDGPGVQRALAEALPAITDASINRIMQETSRPGAVRQQLKGF